MSTNLTTARTGLVEEIKNCKAAIGHYSTRLETLTRMLSQLDGIDTATTTPTTTPSTKKRGRPSAASVSKAVTKPKPQATNGADVATDQVSPKPKAKTKLPATGSDFMMTLVSEAPQSLADLHTAAQAAIGIKVKGDDALKLKQRLTSFLTSAVKAGSVVSTGERRERRFARAVQH